MKNKYKNMILSLTLILYPIIYFVFPTDHSNDIIVAVLDTGVDDSHPLLENRLIEGYDFIDFDSDPEDVVGHGTHVAGIITTNSPNAKIMPVRVITEKDEVQNTYLAIIYAVMNGADIINMSYAESYNTLTYAAIKYGQSKGVVFVASSGNQGIDNVYYPAKYSGVLSISGYDERNHQLFGNYGELVNFIAPGMNIRSAGLNGDYTNKSGTSMSAAYVSGVLSFLKTNEPDLNSLEIKERLYEISEVVTIKDSNKEHTSDYSLVDFKNLTNLYVHEFASHAMYQNLIVESEGKPKE
ncbi:S8 family peptidase [Chengkuizengella axinellae]|uniref:S8 family serine peptidase n=1 Tax=Chengkuizengella axinellae TaxID=3064388 RepID=A0ABT9IXS5_9BACL|nr:S8 family serine peptidase [Chengkuizengella sp. 2205SS18-9]MDP5274162.1 S8 family serine peptidase [Chengkuizengella sp. 2205SS18-9]